MYIHINSTDPIMNLISSEPWETRKLNESKEAYIQFTTLYTFTILVIHQIPSLFFRLCNTRFLDLNWIIGLRGPLSCIRQNHSNLQGDKMIWEFFHSTECHWLVIQFLDLYQYTHLFVTNSMKLCRKFVELMVLLTKIAIHSNTQDFLGCIKF